MKFSLSFYVDDLHFRQMIKIASECPVLEDTVMRLLVIGLSRDLALTPPDAIEFVDVLIRRSANLSLEGIGYCVHLATYHERKRLYMGLSFFHQLIHPECPNSLLCELSMS